MKQKAYNYKAKNNKVSRLCSQSQFVISHRSVKIWLFQRGAYTQVSKQLHFHTIIVPTLLPDPSHHPPSPQRPAASCFLIPISQQ